MTYLLHTNAFSDLMREHPAVDARLAALDVKKGSNYNIGGQEGSVLTIDNSSQPSHRLSNKCWRRPVFSATRQR